MKADPIEIPWDEAPRLKFGFPTYKGPDHPVDKTLRRVVQGVTDILEVPDFFAGDLGHLEKASEELRHRVGLLRGAASDWSKALGLERAGKGKEPESSEEKEDTEEEDESEEDVPARASSSKSKGKGKRPAASTPRRSTRGRKWYVPDF